MNGILAIDKPRGLTSHDVVARVRRIFGQRRVGHAGTLDPMATGVLLVCLGEATRLSEALMEGRKWYLARVSFGVRTDTDDAEGTAIATAVPRFSEADLVEALGRQVGGLRQVPPSYAAIKRGVVPAYRQARAGQVVELESRPVTVFALALLARANSVEPVDGSLGIARADLLICCSKGTYIRSIARDLGDDLGCGAHLSGLRRLASGGFSTRDCVSLARLADLGSGEPAAPSAVLHPSDTAIAGEPACLLGQPRAARIATGSDFQGPHGVRGPLRVYDAGGSLLALASPGDAAASVDLWHPYRVFGAAGA